MDLNGPSGLNGSLPATEQKAPTFTVPHHRIVNVEHPCIIRNVDNGIKSLGGSERLNEFLSSEMPAGTKSTGVSLRPEDAFAKPVASRCSHVNEVLLKVVVPKRTGRKRKRGSNEPFDNQINQAHELAAPADSPKKLLQAMRDNVDRYKVDVVGVVRESHRFRSIPDSQHATSTIPLVDTLRDSIMHLDHEKIKNFRFGPDFGARPGQDVGPPAHYTSRDTHDIPHVYSYKQHQNVVVTIGEDGKAVNTNTGKVKQHFNHSLEPDAESVPNGIPPDADLEPEEKQTKRVRGYIKKIREVMETRPILTKRVINAMLDRGDNDTRYAWAYCGYVFRSGPWRDALIKFGVDPRKDPGLRLYQCFTFKIDKNRFSEDGLKQKWQHYGPKRQATGARRSYEFDGQHLVTDGKVFQLCDITDPLLKSIIETPVIRKDFSQTDGWFLNGTIAKFRVIMKHKLDLCIAGKSPDDDFYQRLATFPDELPSGQAGTLHWRELVATDARGPPTKEEQLLSENIRTLASAARDTRKTRTYQTRVAEDPTAEADAPDAAGSGDEGIDDLDGNVDPDEDSWLGSDPEGEED